MIVAYFQYQPILEALEYAKATGQTEYVNTAIIRRYMRLALRSSNGSDGGFAYFFPIRIDASFPQYL
jgi:hypothetical protein